MFHRRRKVGLMLKRAARKMLPGRAYGMGRRLVHNYKNYKHQRLPKLSEAEFRHILTDTLGVRAGAVVFVHSSMGQINLGFSFHRVLAALVEAVGVKEREIQMKKVEVVVQEDI